MTPVKHRIERLLTAVEGADLERGDLAFLGWLTACPEDIFLRAERLLARVRRAAYPEVKLDDDDPCPRCGGDHDRIDSRDPCPVEEVSGAAAS